MLQGRVEALARRRRRARRSVPRGSSHDGCPWLSSSSISEKPGRGVRPERIEQLLVRGEARRGRRASGRDEIAERARDAPGLLGGKLRGGERAARERECRCRPPQSRARTGHRRGSSARARAPKPARRLRRHRRPTRSPSRTCSRRAAKIPTAHSRLRTRVSKIGRAERLAELRHGASELHAAAIGERRRVGDETPRRARRKPVGEPTPSRCRQPLRPDRSDARGPPRAGFRPSCSRAATSRSTSSDDERKDPGDFAAGRSRIARAAGAHRRADTRRAVAPLRRRVRGARAGAALEASREHSAPVAERFGRFERRAGAREPERNRKPSRLRSGEVDRGDAPFRPRVVHRRAVGPIAAGRERVFRCGRGHRLGPTAANAARSTERTEARQLD